jgi:hypothetical protein
MGMTKNPLINALSAILYIVLVVFTINYGMTSLEGEPETLIIPIAMLSLFVFSAAMMGFIFLSKPLQLYLDGEKQKAIHLFVSTTTMFGVITAIIFFSVFSGILS